MHFAKTTLVIGITLLALAAGGCAQIDPVAATSCNTPLCDIYTGG